MLVRELKLKLCRRQQKALEKYLSPLQDIYNWGIKQIELDAGNKIYHNQKGFSNILALDKEKKSCPNLSKLNTVFAWPHQERQEDFNIEKIVIIARNELNISSHTIQAILSRAWIAWKRCFKKLAKKPRLKSRRNRLNSIPFPDPFTRPVDNKISIPLLGSVKYFKQELPGGPIKNGRIIQRSSGWYLQITIDTNYKLKVDNHNNAVGIDTGFKTLATLSDGNKYELPDLSKLEKRYKQALRGRNYMLAARLQERLANKRKNNHHHVSKDIVKKYDEIYITDDKLSSMAHKAKRDGNQKRKRFGKSVQKNGISQLRNFISYKGLSVGRIVELVDSKKTTMRCPNCGALTGPTGLGGLAVRDWTCSACGAHHDRDVAAAINVLINGSVQNRAGLRPQVPRNGGKITGNLPNSLVGAQVCMGSAVATR